MYKKLFGIVLVAHLLVLGYLGLRTDDSPKLDENDAFQSEFASPQGQAGTPTLEDEDDLLELVKPKFDKPVALEFDVSAPNQLPTSIRSDDLRTGLLVEIPSGRVLWQKDREKSVGIASMTKMMTALLAFEDIRIRDEIDFETQVQVTNAAYRIGGSQVWLDPREIFSLEELLISVMVKSANDSAYLLGEFLSGGSMSQFIVRMNQRAQELKMDSTHSSTRTDSRKKQLTTHRIAKTWFDSPTNCSNTTKRSNGHRYPNTPFEPTPTNPPCSPTTTRSSSRQLGSMV